MSTETSPAVKLRSQVVGRVVLSLIGLSFAELGIIALLIATKTPVPGELWLAFGGSTSALTALLVNTKNDGPALGAPGAPLAVEGVQGGEPVAVEEPPPRRR